MADIIPPIVSYSTATLYASVPQFIQDQDAAAGYPLYLYLYGFCQALDQLNLLYFDDMGAGVTVQPINLYAQAVTLGYITAPLTNSTTTFTIFGTDSTWLQINTASSFVYVANYAGSTVSVIATSSNTVVATVTVGANPYAVAVTPNGSFVYVANYAGNTVSVIATSSNTVVATVTVGVNPYAVAVTPNGSFVLKIENEKILVPSGTYNWNAPTVTLTGVTRGYEGTIAVAHKISSGANGTIDLENYISAPGWSQVVDITRCPEYALPWLGQFIGSAIPQDNGFTYEQLIQKISQRSGFQRSTPASIAAELTTVINSQLSSSDTPMLNSQVIVMENTAPMGFKGANLATAITTTGATSLTLTNTDSTFGTLGSNSSFVIQIDTEKILVPAGVNSWANSPVSLSGVTRGYAGTTATTHLIGALVSVISATDFYYSNEYALTLLIPAKYYDAYTYSSLVAAAGGAGTYTAVEGFITTLGGTYGSIIGSIEPIAGSSYVNFIYRYRPAGIQVFIGGY
jgi:YVTN family beta-propeller protein